MPMYWRACARFALFLMLGLGLAHAAEPPVVSAFSPTDESRQQHQRQTIRDLAALHLGRAFGGVKERDLETLQKLLDDRVVESEDSAQLQSMGVILGDLLAHELDMRWVIYEDREGRSRALQLGETQNFLFPITMISRRAEIGIKVNVTEIYAKAVSEMEPYVSRRYRRP
jgi:hypothetical protein